MAWPGTVKALLLLLAMIAFEVEPSGGQQPP
jgi:hypothetical protein